LGRSDTVFVIDSDLGRMEWEKQLTTGSSSEGGIPQCPGGMTANLTRPTVAAIPSLPYGGEGGRRTLARWILAPVYGPPAPDAGFSVAGASVTRGAIISWKITEKDGAPALEPGWVSRDLVSPVPPTMPAVLYALDALMGRELWNSGTTIKSFVRGSALSGGGGRFYVVTHDGTIYAFGFPTER
jgi:outer membrane protein assembly factor BamB